MVDSTLYYRPQASIQDTGDLYNVHMMKVTEDLNVHSI